VHKIHPRNDATGVETVSLRLYPKDGFSKWNLLAGSMPFAFNATILGVSVEQPAFLTLEIQKWKEGHGSPFTLAMETLAMRDADGGSTGLVKQECRKIDAGEWLAFTLQPHSKAGWLNVDVEFKRNA
jgi:hypothetical protein